jgi:two-component system, NtrC family, sensor kinase
MTSSSETEAIKQKIDKLNYLAWSLRVHETEKAHTLSKEAADLSQKIKYLKGQADAYRLIGFAWIRKSDLVQAKPYLEKAFQVYNSLNDLQGLAVVNEYNGIIHRITGDCKSALENIYKALELCRKTKFWDAEITTLYQLGVTYKQLGNYNKALEFLFESLLIAKSSTFKIMEAYNLNVIGSIYFETGDYKEALNYFQQGLPIRQQANDYWGEAGSLDSIGHTYMKMRQYDQAIIYCKKSLEISEKVGDKKGQANSLLHLAEIYHEQEKIAFAVKYSNESLNIRKSSGDIRGEAEVLLFIAALEPKDSNNKSEFLLKAATIAENVNAFDLLNKIRLSLYLFYKDAGKYEEALVQLELHVALVIEIHKTSIAQKMANLEISHKAEEAQREADVIRLKNNELNKLNKVLVEQKQNLQQALSDLKMTQSQLIQSEKMASLGELTAGIAHEIQNPLNFVNNFSEVNEELIDELTQELAAGNEQSAVEIAKDIKGNQQKILHHGKRADAIVKGMLQHSRSSSGIKELTDINALADEYLRLAYHGLRAKDKSFNANMKTDFDESIGKINIVPQDIGRVILNLITNAFYVVNEKKKQQPEGYEPMVSVSTKMSPAGGGKGVVISVKDNGNGIPDSIKEKIFQPFFTTKPTGQGTGLGLSMSYDIVKNMHQGDIKVNSKEGEGTEFIVVLPIT